MNSSERQASPAPRGRAGGAIAAFFDLDGTLITGHMYSEIVKLRLRSPGWWRAGWYLLSHFALVPFRKARLISRRRFVVSWTADLAGVLAGMPVESADRLFSETASRLVATARPDTLALLKEHQEKGHTTVLVSGVFQPLLTEVARRLGVTHAVGSQLEVKGGKYTGRLNGPLCFSEEKARQALEYMRAHKLDISLEQSYSYADRVYDLPFLEMVGHPAAVYPDLELLARAREKGWRVVGANQ